MPISAENIAIFFNILTIQGKLCFTGSLPRKDVLDIVDQYNKAFSLNIDMTRANMLAIAPENLDKSGNILLRPFLANLSADRTAYKV